MEIIIVTGEINSGKSQLLEKLCAEEKLRGVKPSGIIARGIFKNNIKIGFDIEDQFDGVSMPLARSNYKFENGFSVGKFNFSGEAFEFAKRALLSSCNRDVVFIDEIGPLELKGGGYNDCLCRLLQSEISKLYIAVRKDCLAEFKAKYLRPYPHAIVKYLSADGLPLETWI